MYIMHDASYWRWRDIAQTEHRGEKDRRRDVLSAALRMPA